MLNDRIRSQKVLANKLGTEQPECKLYQYILNVVAWQVRGDRCSCSYLDATDAEVDETSSQYTISARLSEIASLPPRLQSNRQLVSTKLPSTNADCNGEHPIVFVSCCSPHSTDEAHIHCKKPNNYFTYDSFELRTSSRNELNS